MGLINGTVKLENNYDTWQKIFENEKNILNSIFNNKFTIEHVGSTSVKGLLAKPIVDIAIGINDFNDLNIYMDSLKKLYTIKENLDRNEILLIKENEIETFVLIHIMLLNDKRYNDIIKFRDILNNNFTILKEYENLKLELANLYSNDRNMYTKSKNEYIQNILNNYRM